MNWPYIHTVVNHFPIILTVVGTAALATALIWRRRPIWLYAVATLTLAGLSIYPAFLSGDEADHVMDRKWYVVKGSIDEHEETAEIALWIVLATGVIAAYTWWSMTRPGQKEPPPVWLRGLLLVAAIASVVSITYSSYLGGRIVHDSPKLAQPPGAAQLPPQAP